MHPTPMTLRLAQAANTWLTRRWLSIGGGVLWSVFCLPLVPTMYFSAAPARMEIGTVFVIFMPTLLATVVIAAQANWQFVHPRARLIPGYAAPHLGLLGLLYLLVAIGMPLAWAAALGVAPLGLPAIGAAMSAAILWGGQRKAVWLTLPALALPISLLSPITNPIWLAHDGRFVALHGVFLLGSLALVASWMRGLATMREDDQAYRLVVTEQFSSGSRFEKSAARQTAARQIKEGSFSAATADRWHDCLPAPGSGASIGPERLLAYGAAPLPLVARVLMMGALLLAVFGAEYLVFEQFGGGDNLLYFVPFFFACLGAAAMRHQLSSRRPRMQHELLFPLTRREYVYGLLRRSWVELLTWLAVALAIAFLLLLWRRADYLTPPRITAGLAILAALTLLSHGLVVRLALMNSLLMAMLAAFGLVYLVLGVGAGGIALEELLGLPACLAACVVVAAVGAYLDRRATRAWMNAELGK